VTLSPSDIDARLTAVRDASPLVQCIANAVVLNHLANTLLALGCAPAMVDIPEEAGAFARTAAALLINLGTPYAEPRAAALEAVASATDAGVPWVLDPVAVGSLPVRTRLARELLRHQPAVIRGNPSEVMALAGSGRGGRGTDTLATADDARQAAQDLAQRHQAVVAVSGETDLVTDGVTDLRVRNGHPWLTRITGGGCALGATVAAFVALDSSQPFKAVAAAVAAYAIAAEQAAAHAAGPGSFKPAFVDALHNLDQATIAARLNMS